MSAETTKIDFGRKERGFQDFKSEPRVAAYLGYRDLGQFRRFRFSEPVLRFYTAIAANYHGWNYGKAIKIFWDISEHELSYAFPDTIDGIVDKYQEQTGAGPEVRRLNLRKRDWMLAAFLFRLAEAIERCETMNEDDLQAAQLRAVTACRTPPNTTSMPVINVGLLVWPELGPHEQFGEHQVEKYNRLLMVIRSLGHTLTQSKWQDLLGPGKPDPFRRAAIPGRYVPSFMREAPPAERVIIAKLIKEPETDVGVALEAHCKEFLAKKRYRLPAFCNAPDPTSIATPEEWRDIMRRDIDIKKLRVDFVAINFRIPEEGARPAQEGILFDIDNPREVMNWQSFQQMLNESEAGSLELTYLLRPLEYDEEMGDVFEFGGLPMEDED